MEKIKAAAISWGGVTFTADRPGRHRDVMTIMAARGFLEARMYERQGFVTTSGRFVYRDEAKLIAIKAGQLIRPSPGGDLYSEDLW